MKKLTLLSRSRACALGLALFSSTASAQSPDAVYIAAAVTAGATSIVTGVTTAINNFFASLSSKIDTDWKATQPNLQTITGVINPEGVALTTAQDQTVTNWSSTFIGAQMTPSITPPQGPMPSAPVAGATLSTTLLGQVAGDILPAPPINAASAKIQTCGNLMFNFESLMGYSSYANQVPPCDPNAQAGDVSSYANYYIQYVADMANQTPTFNILQQVNNNTMSLAQAQTLQQSAQWISYETALRRVVSVQSAGLSNLYYLYAQRVPDANGNSPESVSNYLANWRSQNPTWYSSMGSALPTVLLRETLFVLTEMQRDLHEMRKENQRLLAVQSVAMIQASLVSKQLLQLKIADVQTQMQSIVNPAPPSTTGSGSSSSAPASTTGNSSSTNTLNQINNQSSSSSSNALSKLGVSPDAATTGGGTSSTSTGKN